MQPVRPFIAPLALFAALAWPNAAVTQSYQINAALTGAEGFDRLVVAPMNLGKPSRRYLRERERAVDARLAWYLRENGFSVDAATGFERLWSDATHRMGDYYDPSSDHLNATRMRQVAAAAIAAYAEADAHWDAIVFTNLVERKVAVSNVSGRRRGKWDGVTRRVGLRGGGSGVSADFDWNRPITAASLQVVMIDRGLAVVFSGIGGLELVQAVSTRKSRYVPAVKILANTRRLDEGVRIALHPLVEMDDYPGKQQ